MILAVHAIVGASIGRLLPQNPIWAFIFGFLSHFLLDAIPHFEYKLSSLQKNSRDSLKDTMVLGKAFLEDLAKIGLDCLSGIFLILLFLKGRGETILSHGLIFGVIGGILPDFLQFLYFKLPKNKPLTLLQKFHLYIHAPHLNRIGRKNFKIAELISQPTVILLVFFISRFVF